MYINPHENTNLFDSPALFGSGKTMSQSFLSCRRDAAGCLAVGVLLAHLFNCRMRLVYLVGYSRWNSSQSRDVCMCCCCFCCMKKVSTCQLTATTQIIVHQVILSAFSLWTYLWYKIDNIGKCLAENEQCLNSFDFFLWIFCINADGICRHQHAF